MMDQIIIYFILPLMSISMLLIFVRLFKGPTLMDKIIALDLLVIVGIGSFSAYAILFDRAVVIDISLILALVAFLSTIAFTYSFERRKEKQDTENE